MTFFKFEDYGNSIIELENKDLVSSSFDNCVIYYSKDKNKYREQFKISSKYPCLSITQTKENEICYSEYIKDLNYNICFYDLNKRSIKASINHINSSGTGSPFNLILKDLLIIGGKDEISIINVNKYKLIRKIKVPNSDWIYGFCKINENIFFTGDHNGEIYQWEIKGDNLTLISKKKNIHKDSVVTLIKIRNGHIASGSSDMSIKIW